MDIFDFGENAVLGLQVQPGRAWDFHFGTGGIVLQVGTGISVDVD